jgi:hydrogenase/urease accessory protein HupE
MNRGRAIACAIALAFVMLVCPRAAHAHALGVSNGEYAVEAHAVTAKLTFARSELGSADPANLLRAIAVRRGETACTGALQTVTATEQDGVAIQARFDCGAASGDVQVSLGFWDDVTHGHRHLVRAVGTSTFEDVCHRSHPEFSFAAGAPAESQSRSALPFVTMGIEHILTGFDHLLFLVALVIVGGRLRSLLGIVTAFTVAHSVTLAIATLGIWSPSARFVEPAIALSIAYVGIENFFVRSARSRWRLTFLFGLIHGFGFAGALREIALPRADVPLALLAFNGGVEIGQLAVMAAVLPALALLRKYGALSTRAVRFGSAAVVVTGLVWFVERAFA